jgi:peptidoglycan/xylan/chitin deacetylase (PgdA/CDA1 family)
MGAIRILAGLALGLLTLAGRAEASGCADPSAGLGVSRVIEIDTSTGALFGDLTKFPRHESLLAPKEVVLTFDDGPLPIVTRSVLDTLDRFCTKATFFSIGRMAIAYPATVREVLARGHTLGSHTWSHPLTLHRLRPEAARDEIERGFAAVALAAGEPIAPFFRFPGLSDNAELLAHLQSRGIATFSVDVVSNDSFVHDAGRLVQTTLQKLEARKGGILLFHDIKAATARALPVVLAELKQRGYRVVHLRAKQPLEPLAEHTAALQSEFAKALGGAQAVPFYAGTSPPKAADGHSEPPVTRLAPELKAFDAGASGEPRSRRPRQRPDGAGRTPATSGWATTLERRRRALLEE